MKVIEGSRTTELSKEQLSNLTRGFGGTEIDLGTGDGRFVYKNARKNTNIFYIGIDPSQKQLEVYSKKAVKEKMENVLFVLGSVETLPNELKETADVLHINFPWGSLLGGIANADEKIILGIISLLKPNGILKIIFGYSQEFEPTETERLNLQDLDENWIKERVIPAFVSQGMFFEALSQFEKKDLFAIESTWGKKHSFGQERKIFKLEMSMPV